MSGQWSRCGYENEGEDSQVQVIPGTYGGRITGSIKDRFDFFVKQGSHKFFKKRMEKYKSTVFRANLPPGPPLFPETQAIVVVDAVSFRVLFDSDKVEKKDTLTGTYMPSKDFFGGFRMLAYLDTSEQHHSNLKGFCFHALATASNCWLPEFHKASSELWSQIDAQFCASGKASFNPHNEHMLFNFLCRCIVKRNPGDTSLGKDGPSCVKRWLAPQLAPLVSTGIIPKLLEEITIHAVPLPFLLVRREYKKLYHFFTTNATHLLDAQLLERFGLKDERDMACHNLVFMVCFNAFGGMMLLFPNIVRRIVEAGGELQRKLAREVRGAAGGLRGAPLLDHAALQRMPLVRSTVFEVLRMDPPVPFQYAKARRDFLLHSHHGNRYHVKKGELLAGYQPLAMRDPHVFEDPDQFIPDRFLQEQGQNLLQHLFWSNGPQTQDPSLQNKQCPGKDYVLTTSCLFVAHMFLRYDSLDIDATPASPLLFTALNKPAFPSHN